MTAVILPFEPRPAGSSRRLEWTPTPPEPRDQRLRVAILARITSMQDQAAQVHAQALDTSIDPGEGVLANGTMPRDAGPPPP